MALFLLRQEYLETRIMLHDPSLDGPNSRRRRSKANPTRKIPFCVTSTGGFNLDDHLFAETENMALLNHMYTSIEDNRTYKLSVSQLKGHVGQICRQ